MNTAIIAAIAIALAAILIAAAVFLALRRLKPPGRYSPRYNKERRLEPEKKKTYSKLVGSKIFVFENGRKIAERPAERIRKWKPKTFGKYKPYKSNRAL